MNFASCTRTELRSTTGIILLLSLLLFLPRTTPAAELSNVPAVSPPMFSLPDLAGEQHSLGEFAGKVVLVTFWASWCRPCIEEIPSIQRLQEAMADQPFAVVGVNVGEGQRRAQVAARRMGIAFPVLLDEDSTTFRAWGADVLPTAYILDRDGRIRHLARGPLEWDRVDIIEMLTELATERSPDRD